MNKDRAREAIDARFETADTVAQSLRQHRNHAIGQINTVSASTRLSIKRAVGLHIRRVIGIDGDDEFSAQIFASLELPGINGLGNSLCLVQNIPGKFGWQMIFFDD